MSKIFSPKFIPKYTTLCNYTENLKNLDTKVCVCMCVCNKKETNKFFDSIN